MVLFEGGVCYVYSSNGSALHVAEPVANALRETQKHLKRETETAQAPPSSTRGTSRRPRFVVGTRSNEDMYQTMLKYHAHYRTSCIPLGCSDIGTAFLVVRPTGASVDLTSRHHGKGSSQLTKCVYDPLQSPKHLKLWSLTVQWCCYH